MICELIFLLLLGCLCCILCLWLNYLHWLDARRIGWDEDGVNVWLKRHCNLHLCRCCGMTGTFVYLAAFAHIYVPGCFEEREKSEQEVKAGRLVGRPGPSHRIFLFVVHSSHPRMISISIEEWFKSLVLQPSSSDNCKLQSEDKESQFCSCFSLVNLLVGSCVK